MHLSHIRGHPKKLFNMCVFHKGPKLNSRLVRNNNDNKTPISNSLLNFPVECIKLHCHIKYDPVYRDKSLLSKPLISRILKR